LQQSTRIRKNNQEELLLRTSKTRPKPDIEKVHPIVYTHYTYFNLGKQVGKAFSAGKKYRKK
jgi:hypothetical protein